MNRIIIATLLLIGMSAQFAMASENSSRFYAGAGLAQLTNNHGMGVTYEEARFISSPITLSSGRTENNNTLSGNAFLGYKFSDSLAIELGYLGQGKGFTSETSGPVKANLPTTNGSLGPSTVVPFSVTQTKKLSSWHISAIGEKPLTERVSLLGRVGVMKSETSWEQRLTYNCNPVSCVPYQVKADTSNKTSPLFGVGLAMKMAERVSVRVEVMKSSALPSIAPRADLLFRF